MLKIIFQLTEGFLRNIPGSIGRKVRYWYYKNRLGACGKNLYIDVGVIITDPKSVFIGNNVWLDNYVLIISGAPVGNRKIYRKPNASYEFADGELHIGDNVHIAPFVVVQSHGGVSIGANCGLASGAKLYSFSNHYKDLNSPDDKGPFYFTPLAPIEHQAYILSPIVLVGDNAIGLNSVILPGTTLPIGTWIGTNVFLQGTKIKQQAIYSGNPGRLIKTKDQ